LQGNRISGTCSCPEQGYDEPSTRGRRGQLSRTIWTSTNYHKS
jgi:hypothetical protein